MTMRIGSAMRGVLERKGHGQRRAGLSARLNLDTPAENPRTLPDPHQAGAVHRQPRGIERVWAEAPAVVLHRDHDCRWPARDDDVRSRRAGMLDDVADSFLNDPEHVNVR